MTPLERFLRYATIDTQSSETSAVTPSTASQLSFAHLLVADLKAIGLNDVRVSSYGYVTATLPANTTTPSPTIGLIAHMDTSPDYTAHNVRPHILHAYDGTDVTLNPEKGIVMSAGDFPELRRYVGDDIIFTDGTTLLGADDKAGIVAIFAALESLLAHPERPHATVRICFTPDEEIGRGADHFDVEAFGADYAYTIDGGAIGELEYETFNAAEAVVTFNGRNVHPGAAYKKMINSQLLAAEFVQLLPPLEIPQETRGYQGFYHLTGTVGAVEETTLKYIIRDFDRRNFENRKRIIAEAVQSMQAKYGEGVASITIRDQYYNMREKIEPVIEIVHRAEKAIRDSGIEPHVIPVRGGTDGSRLSFMGLPCPNIFAGGENFHSQYEFLPVSSLLKACEVVERLVLCISD